MLRRFTVTILLLLLSSFTTANAADPEAAKGDSKTLGTVTEESALVPAVHVNSNGIDSNYGGNNGAVNRLRAVQDSVFLPPLDEKPQTADNDSTSSTPTTRTDRVGRTARPSDGAAPKIFPRSTTDVKPAPPKKLLPSVVTRRSMSAADTTDADTTVTDTTAADPPPADTAIADIPVPEAPKIEAPSESLTIDVSPALTATTIDAPATTGVPTAPLASRAMEKELVADNSGFQIGAASSPPTRPLANVDAPASMPQPLQTPASATGSPRATNPRATPRQPAAQDDEENILLSNRSPVLVVKTHGQPTIKVGRVATYYVSAANIGDLAAEDVVVSVNVPNWAEITRNQATSGMVRIEPSESGDNILKWSLSDLKPKNQQRLRIDLIPRSSQSIDLGVTWNFKSVSALAQIEVQEPKLSLAVTGPADILYGETKMYSISVSNPGSGDAENVVLTLLPIQEGTGSAGSRELGTIKAGARRNIEVELTARQAGDLAVRATATGDGGLQAEGQQQVRVRRANLVVQALGPARKYAGTEARYTIKISNTGDATAQNIVAVAALPMAAQYVKSSHAGTFDNERARVRWSIGALRPGAFQLVEVTTKLTGSGANRMDVRVAGAQQLTAAGSVVTEVESLADLRMSVFDPAGVVALNTEMTYEVHIVNRGTKAAHNVNVVGYFSEGIEPVNVQGWRADVEVGQVVLDTIPRISPGQEMVIKVIAKADRPGNHVFRTELDSKDPQTKLAIEEWTVFHQEEGRPVTSDASTQQADASPLGQNR